MFIRSDSGMDYKSQISIGVIFIDLGCGDGLSIFLLSSEGYIGFGTD